MGLWKDIQNQPVSELDLRELIALPPTALVSQAVGLMRRKGLGCVVVVDDQGKPLGKFTERCLIKMLTKGLDLNQEEIGNHMAREWCTVTIADKIQRVVDAMQRDGLRFVIVTDEDGRACALTGQKGVMEYIAEHFPREVKVQAIGSKVSIEQREGA